MVQGRVEQAHLFKRNKIKLQEIRSNRAQGLGEDLIREDLCDKDVILAF